MQKNSRFDFIFYPKKSSELTVFIPGWGYDGRLFDEWVKRCETSALVVERYSPFHFSEDLAAEMSLFSPSTVSLVGFSMGGFVAVDYALRHKVSSLLLWSVRSRYPHSELAFIRKQVEQDPEKTWEFSHRFHVGKSREAIQFLKEIKQTMVFPGKENLLEGLRYLETAVLTSERIKPLDSVVFLHGSEDPLAPLSEVENLSKSSSLELRIIQGAPHLFRP